MSRHTYRWYRIPDRLALGLYALAASLWRDWFPGRVCATCRWYKDLGRGEGTCNRELGFGYGAETAAKGACEHWHELRHCPYCKATDHDLDHCPERWQPKKESK